MKNAYQMDYKLGGLSNCTPDMGCCENVKAPEKPTVSERMLKLKEMAAEAKSRAEDLAAYVYGNNEKTPEPPTWEPANLDETVDWIAEKMKDTLRIMQEVRERL